MEFTVRSEVRKRPALAACALLAACAAPVDSPPPDSPPPDPPREWSGEPVEIARFSADGELLGVETVKKLRRNESAWREALSPAAYAILRDGGTELAYSGRYDGFYEPGVYRCAGCGTAAFFSKAKYDSKTGWPSFYEPIDPRDVYTDWDTSWGMRRRAVLCARCDSHLGHVFKDGPPPTYLRYCINSAALELEAAE